LKTGRRLAFLLRNRLPELQPWIISSGKPGAMLKEGLSDGTVRRDCACSPYSLRVTTATRLLEPGVDIRKAQELLRHRHVTTTQIYDKRRRKTAESASHDLHF
jgi:site-specific recombinase XerD